MKAFLVMMSLFVCSCEKEPEPAAAAGSTLQKRLEAKRKESAGKPSLQDLERQAEICLRAVQSRLRAEDAVQAAELALEDKVTAGSAQLAAVKLQEAKEVARSEKAEATAEREKLEAMEAAAGLPDPPSLLIQQVDDAGRGNINKRHLVLKYKGILSPEFKPLWSEFLWLSMTLRLGDAAAGNFTPPEDYLRSR